MAGYKDFADGNVLTGDEIDGYLMRQAVMRFATPAARGTALTGVAEDGMCVWTDDTDTLWVLRGGVWAAIYGGDVPRVDSILTADTSALTSSTWTAITGWSTASPGGIEAITNTPAGTFNVPYAGRYLVTAALAFTANGTGQRGVRVLFNGSASLSPIYTAAAGQHTTASVTVTRRLVTADTIKIEGFQSSGAGLAVRGDSAGQFSQLSITRIGA